jgi:hypothetical protein
LFKNGDLGLCPSCEEIFVVNGAPLISKTRESLSKWIEDNNPRETLKIIVEPDQQNDFAAAPNQRGIKLGAVAVKVRGRAACGC